MARTFRVSEQLNECVFAGKQHRAMTFGLPPAPPTRGRDWGESGALLLSVVLFLSLRDRYTLGPPSLTWSLGILLVLVLLLSLFWTIKGERKATRAAMSASALILAVGVGASLAKVV